MLAATNSGTKMTDQIFITNTFIKLKDTILNIDNKVVPDIYAISFYKSNDNDDPRHPLLTVGYNTFSSWASCTPKPGQKAKWPIASNTNEAKWNFAFWLQNEELIIGGEEFNPVSGWVKELPFYYTDDEAEKDFDRAMEKAEEINEKFIQIIIEHAKRLHRDGIIFQKFEREIPIIIHELEYYDDPLNWTKQANPNGLTTEFENWIIAMKNV